VFNLAENVDNSEAETILNREWNRVRTDDKYDYLDDKIIGRDIEEVLNASQESIDGLGNEN
jgi:hypothetical protein